MSGNQQRSSVSSAVMEQIKSGDVRMKPRAYFTLLSAVSIGAVFLAGLSMAYLWSIVMLWIRIETASTPAWGARANLATAAAEFPWWAVIVSLLLLVSAVLLVRRQGHLYRFRIATLALVLLLCTILTGAALSAFDVGRSHSPNRLDQPGNSNGKSLKRNNNQKDTP